MIAPGFIDTHFHAVDPFGTKLGVADGITTGMDLESGAMPVREWYAQKEKNGNQMNYGTTTGLAPARMIVHDPELKIEGPIDATNNFGYGGKAGEDGVAGWSLTRSNVEQMNQIMKLLEEDLRQGALGIGVPAAYMARGLTSYEQFETQRTAARYGRLVSVHTRYHLNSQTPTEAPIALDEILANAMVLRAPLLMAHDNDYGWWENEDVEAVRSRAWFKEYVFPSLNRVFEPNHKIHGSFFYDWTTELEVNWKRNFTLWIQFVNDFKNRGGRVTVGSDAGFIYNLHGFGYVRGLDAARPRALRDGVHAEQRDDRR